VHLARSLVPSSSCSGGSAAAWAHPLARRPAAMGVKSQKPIDAFFKRPASARAGASSKAGAGAPASDGSAAGQQQQALAVAGVSAPAAAAASRAVPAVGASAAGDGAGGDTVAAAAAAPENLAGAEGSGAAAAADVHEAQLSERQLMRSHANRNAALAKQVGAVGGVGGCCSKSEIGMWVA